MIRIVHLRVHLKSYQLAGSPSGGLSGRIKTWFQVQDLLQERTGAGTGPVPGSAHYGAAKAGTNSLTWTFAAEFAPNIRVNAVAPGAIPTEVMLKAIGKDETQLDSILEEWNIPLGRLGTPEDISSACIYLSSDAASWVSGEILRVGGGAKPR